MGIEGTFLNRVKAVDHANPQLTAYSVGNVPGKLFSTAAIIVESRFIYCASFVLVLAYCTNFRLIFARVSFMTLNRSL